MSDVSPGQLYKTASGHLYHAGKICILMVGLPARGKTHRAVLLTRYLRWLGVRVRAFRLGDYRRRITADGDFSLEEYFSPHPSPEYQALHLRVLQACWADIHKFYNEGGQVAVYDAVNATAAERRRFASELKQRRVECLFVESLVTREAILARNVDEIRRLSEDYRNLDPEEALAHYLRAIEAHTFNYEPMAESELVYVKLIDDSKKCVVNNGPLGYLLNRVLLFLLNARPKQGSIFLAQCGDPDSPENGRSHYKEDPGLSAEGRGYAERLARSLLAYVSQQECGKRAHLAAEDMRRVTDLPLRNFASGSVSEAVTPVKAPLTVWVSTRKLPRETAEPFREATVPVEYRSLLHRLELGVAGQLCDDELKARYPEEYAAHELDPFRHRWPRGESYQDVVIRLEMLLLELERVETSLLIICHETVLRVVYAYLMGVTAEDIPTLQIPKDQVIEIVPSGFTNTVRYVPIEDLT